MVASPPQACPPPAGVAYSKIGSSSFSVSDKISYGAHGDLQRNKLKGFCVGYGGRALACAVAAVGICLLIVLLIQGHHGHGGGGNKPVPSGSPLVTPTPTPSPVPSTETPPLSPPTPAQALPLSSLCNSTEDLQLCLTTLSAYPSKESTATLQDLTAFVAGAALTEVNHTYALAVNLSGAGNGSRGEMAALQDCLELLDQARDGLNDSINQLSHLNVSADAKEVKGQVMNVQVWMSSSYTDQDTCLSGFDDVEGLIKGQMLKAGQPIGPLIAIALTFADTLKQVGLSSLYALHPSPT